MSSTATLFAQAVELHRAGHLAQAEQLYQRILELDPQHADALHLLGYSAYQTGRYDMAVGLMRQALRLKPDYPEAHNNLGNALKRLGKLEEAVASYRQSLHYRPENALAHNNLGTALKDLGRFDEAIRSYREALRINYESFEVHNNLGIVLVELGRREEAIASFQEALRIKPDHARAWNNRGCALKDLGKFDEAIDSYQKALRLQPDLVEAINNLGYALMELGRLDEANACYRRAIELRPDFVEAYNNLANVQKEAGKFDEAIASYQMAVRLKPDYAKPYNNLGNILKDLGRFDEAIAHYRQALALRPGYSSAHSNLVYSLHFHPDYDSLAILAEAERWNLQHAASIQQYTHEQDRSLDPERRVRIGYVSPDFRGHPVAYSLLPLFAHHDPRQVEIYCYSEVAHPDAITEQLRSRASVWHNTVGQNDERVAAQVRADRIDILIDLALHSANNRLLVFARKPAPVQATWCGYPGTTGLAAIDFRISDPYLDPPESAGCYSEKTIHLPDSFWCYEPFGDRTPVNELPALASGVITFGCLNNFSKINRGVLSLWAQVLRSVPRSRLVLLAPPGMAREQLLFFMTEEGIDSTRLEFVNRQERQQYLLTYQRIDLCLDPVPYNGHTTSLDAFWMGVPTITLTGRTVAGRAGWSQLRNLGLPELAAKTPEEYVKIAVALASDLPRLRDLRGVLRERLKQSPLMDGQRFARHLEQAYRHMWHWYCETRESGE